MKLLWFAAAATTLFVSNIAFANTRICVTVQQKSWYKAVAPRPPAPPQPAPTPPTIEPEGPSVTVPAAPPPPSARPRETDQYGGPAPSQQQWGIPLVGQPMPPPPPEAVVTRARIPQNPHEIDPTQHLRRLLEYEVTHEPGFAAVADACQQRLTVELYQLESGWTVFARYSGTEREEKVDHAELDEFPELAQRIAFALLRNKPIVHTITRENVLRADSEQNLRTINGTGHLVFGMGTSARAAKLYTAQDRTASGATQPAAAEWRAITPVSIQIGYRRKLRAWGLDAFARLNLGTENTGVRNNDMGGHVDYSKSGISGLHFLHYTDAPGINSFYFGGGAAFEIAQFEVIRPVASRTPSTTRDSLVGGGLNIDLLVGYEFLRASSVHFYGQLELNAPAYVMKTESDSGGIDTWMPGVTATIGVIF